MVLTPSFLGVSSEKHGSRDTADSLLHTAYSRASQKGNVRMQGRGYRPGLTEKEKECPKR